MRTIVDSLAVHCSASSVTCAQADKGGLVICCAISNQNIMCYQPQVVPLPFDTMTFFTSSSFVSMLLKVLADSLVASFVSCSTLSIYWSMFPYPLVSYPFCASVPRACIDCNIDGNPPSPAPLMPPKRPSTIFNIEEPSLNSDKAF